MKTYKLKLTITCGSDVREFSALFKSHPFKLTPFEVYQGFNIHPDIYNKMPYSKFVGVFAKFVNNEWEPFEYKEVTRRANEKTPGGFTKFVETGVLSIEEYFPPKTPSLHSKLNALFSA